MSEALLEKWINHVNAGKVESVAAMYSEDAVLLPTFSNRRLKTPEARRGYFDQLSGNKDLSVELHRKSLTVQWVSDSICVLSGIYLWKFEVDEEMLNFEARFSFVMNSTLPAPVLHHHSSQVPRNL